jgi:hypothetical protein
MVDYFRFARENEAARNRGSSEKPTVEVSGALDRVARQDLSQNARGR